MHKILVAIIALNWCFFVSPLLAGNTMLFGGPEPLPEFALVDHDEKPFTKARLEKQWSFIMFGYTSCPDVCPTTLSVMQQAVGLIKANPAKDKLPVKTILVSLDPVRDTPQNLKEYVKYFDEDFMAVTGADNDDIDRLTYPIGVKYDFEDMNTHLPIDDYNELSKDRRYIVNHFAGIFIIDPLARVSAIVFPPHDADQITNIFSFVRQSYLATKK